MNRVQLIGNLGRDADRKPTNNGHRTMLSVATNHGWKDADSGQWKQRTEWHTIVAWGKVAEQAGTLKKGALVFIEGELRGREYEQEDTRHRVSEIVANQIVALAA